MPKFNTTPQPFALYPPPQRAKSADELDNDFADYRHSCNVGLCTFDPEVAADFRRKIAEAIAKEA